MQLARPSEFRSFFGRKDTRDGQYMEVAKDRKRSGKPRLGVGVFRPNMVLYGEKCHKGEEIGKIIGDASAFNLLYYGDCDDFVSIFSPYIN